MTPTRLFLAASALPAALALSACGGGTPDSQPAANDATTAAVTETPQVAMATLSTADGTDAGTVTVTGRGRDIVVAVTAAGMTPGDHGVHIHATGKCEGPKFETAGSHWNPTGAKHGLSNPQGQHHGDMPNLTIGGDGTGQMEYTIEGTSVSEMLDADGAAFVIHADADDQMTDPSGESGDRVACGVFGIS
ncbi:superoxide dismutase family protein [Blastomonas sp.]|uniref:superoxide dismutase family protein n=1 Tax=Blastomonas sp. TaxID=1909299 RepID=UPI00391CEA4E